MTRNNELVRQAHFAALHLISISATKRTVLLFTRSPRRARAKPAITSRWRASRASVPKRRASSQALLVVLQELKRASGGGNARAGNQQKTCGTDLCRAHKATRNAALTRGLHIIHEHTQHPDACCEGRTDPHLHSVLLLCHYPLVLVAARLCFTIRQALPIGLDGYLARKWEQSTALWRFLDPVAEQADGGRWPWLLRFKKPTPILGDERPHMVNHWSWIVDFALREHGWQELGKARHMSRSRSLRKYKTAAQHRSTAGSYCWPNPPPHQQLGSFLGYVLLDDLCGPTSGPCTC